MEAAWRVASLVAFEAFLGLVGNARREFFLGMAGNDCVTQVVSRSRWENYFTHCGCDRQWTSISVVILADSNNAQAHSDPAAEEPADCQPVRRKGMTRGVVSGRAGFNQTGFKEPSARGYDAY
jgi:hypothetical protein